MILVLRTMVLLCAATLFTFPSNSLPPEVPSADMNVMQPPSPR